jgi:hypothetical protein
MPKLIVQTETRCRRGRVGYARFLAFLQILSWAAWLAWCGCSVLIYIHAFRRSIGTGFMVLCIPCYIFYYAFSQFEHPKKGLIVAGLCAAAGLAIVLSTVVFASAGLHPNG